jgi:hypothetical protein
MSPPTLTLVIRKAKGRKRKGKRKAISSVKLPTFTFVSSEDCGRGKKFTSSLYSSLAFYSIPYK